MGAIAPALPYIGAVFSAVSALGQMQAGKAEARGLAQQAALEKVRARGEALKYKAQSVDILKNAVRANASINAMAGAGGIDPATGSAFGLQTASMADAVSEYYISEDNQVIAREGGAIQADIYNQQANQAYRGGLFKAAGTLVSAGTSFAKTRVPTTA